MKRITNILLILLFVCSSITYAQEAAPAYVVYYAKGKSTVNHGGKISALKKADKLYTADKITVAKGAELTLLCASYKLVKLKAGSYNAKNIKCTEGDNSFTAAYFHYVWHQMSHHHEKAEDNPQKYMKTAGAVTRGKNPVNLTLPVDTIYYSSGTLGINWKPAEGGVLLKLFADSLAQVAEQTLTFNKSIPMDSLASKLETGSYLWQLCKPEGTDCGQLNYLEVLESSVYNQNVSALLARVVQSSPAETAFMSGFILEQHFYLAEAAKYYKQAATIEPHNNTYQNAYKRFYE